MNNRTSAVSMVARMFCAILSISVGASFFWNTLSGRNMFPLSVALIVSVIVTVLFVLFGWCVVSAGSNVLLRNDPNYRQWRQQGGRPYWDSLPPPINPDASITSETGMAEPQYTTFTPPASWRFQCPCCGARVQHKVDVCWNCNYGANGDSTAYHQRWGDQPECPDGGCGVEFEPDEPDPPADWQPVGRR